MGDVASALRFLGSLFYREVDAPLLEALRRQHKPLVKTLGVDLLEGLPEDQSAALEELAVDYCQLFIGPRGHLPPVESVARGEGRFFGQSTDAVLGEYRAHGYAPDPSAHTLPDHIAVELDFLAILEDAGRHKEAKLFARNHPIQWLPAIATHVGLKARLPFYPRVLSELEGLLRQLYGDGV